MNKLLKKILKITGIVLVILIAAAFLIPVLFKKQITTLVKKEINKSLTAKVDFKDVSLSLFRHFPKISIALKDLSVEGTGEFAKDTLLSAGTFDASVNLMSAIRGKDIKIYGVFLESPRIHALVNQQGQANWNITKENNVAAADTTTSAFKMNLEKYSISNGYIYYNDETSNMSAEISGLNHEGSGDFTEDLFMLSTKTKANAASFTYESIPYLVNAETGIEAVISIDTKTSKYTFSTDDIKVNNLKLNAAGFFQLANDSTYNMDITFKTPSNDFKDILSLIPAVYKKDFDKIKTSGSAAFNGFVKGTYSPQQLPAYDVNLEIKDGLFQYPDLPALVKNIQIAAHLSNVDGQTDNMVVDISKGHIEMENEPFDFKLLFKRPLTSKYIDAVVKGTLDLASVSKFIKLEPGTKLGGLVSADAFAKGNMSALQTQQGDFSAGGFLNIKNLLYASSAFPQPLQNGNMKIQINNSGGIADNTSVNISEGHIEVGKDPLDFTLQLHHPMSSIDFSGTAKGKFTLDNIKQFTQLEAGTSISGLFNADLSFDGNKTAIDKKEFDKIMLSGTAGLNNLKYISKELPTGITIATTQLAFNPKNVTLSKLEGNYLHTNFSATGVLDNLIGYAMEQQPLYGSLSVNADKMNLNEWMGTMEETPTDTATSSAPFEVPSGIDFTINAKASEVTYDKVNYNNVNGILILKDQTVTLQDVKTEALGGAIAFNAYYSTKADKKNPGIALSYDVKDVSIQKAFLAFNTIQKIMPIAQFLTGTVSSKLAMNGKLKSTMMPDLSTLIGNGNFLLTAASLQNFAPLDKIASTLQIDEMKSMTLKDVKTYIEFANGTVLVKPFNVKVKDIDMQVAGTHGFDKTIDYIVEMKVPRKYLGSAGNNLINNLTAQASSRGLEIKPSETVNLNLRLGGTLTSPSIKTDLKETAGDAVKEMQQQVTDFAKAKADTLKQTVKDTLNSIKKEAVNGLKENIKSQIFGNKDSTTTTGPDSTKSKTEQKLKNTLNGLFNKKKKAADQ
ncbi:MAG: AsmA-like C-terminal region-containing protein [Ginsengibacter sp.]